MTLSMPVVLMLKAEVDLVVKRGQHLVLLVPKAIPTPTSSEATSSTEYKTSSEQSRPIFILQPLPFSSSWPGTPSLPLYFKYTGRSKVVYRLRVTNKIQFFFFCID